MVTLLPFGPKLPITSTIMSALASAISRLIRPPAADLDDRGVGANAARNDVDVRRVGHRLTVGERGDETDPIGAGQGDVDHHTLCIARNAGDAGHLQTADFARRELLAGPPIPLRLSISRSGTTPANPAPSR